MYVELVVIYNIPSTTFSMCFPGVETQLLRIGPNPTAVHGTKPNKIHCPRQTAGTESY